MSAGYEPTFIFTWLRSTLIADSVISTAVGNRIFRSAADPAAAFPNIVMQLQQLRDVVFIGGIRVMVDGFFAIRVVRQGSATSEIDPIMVRIDALLDRQKNVVVSGGEILSCVRQWTQELPFVDNGQLYRQQIGLYAIQAQGTT